MIKITCVFIVLCMAGMSLAGQAKSSVFELESSKMLRAVASKAKLANEEASLLKAGSKNLGYTYKSQYNSAPSYQNNMGGSYSATYNQASQYNGQYQAPGAYNGQYQAPGTYNGQYQAPGNYANQYSGFTVYVSFAYTEAVSANPTALTAEQIAAISKLKTAINDAFAYKPFLYGKSADYKDNVVNSNFDYNSYGGMDFRYFAPRVSGNQQSSYTSSDYKSPSSYTPAKTDAKYDVAPSYKSTPYNAAPYKSDPYNTAPYKSDPYNAAPYKSDPYNAAPYKSGSYNSASYAKDNYKSASYSAPAAYPSEPYQKSSQYGSKPEYNSAPYNKPY